MDELPTEAFMRLHAAVLTLSATLLPTGAAHAQVSLDSVRIAAKDTVALAKFYQAAFGMQEVNRIENPGGTEVFVNFGATVEAAKANKNPVMVLFHRDSDDVKDPVPHIIFHVKDMAATVVAVKAAGGMMTGDPRPFRDSGIVIGFATDPAGNRIELIQRPPAEVPVGNKPSER
jgi:predicted enzyme related to lactoylglutathione lyase